MTRLIVVTLHLSLLLLQFVLVPLWYVLGIFSKSIRKRIQFERVQQGVSPVSADLGFEISSQGELEQVAPIIVDSLSNGQVVQLVYSSASLNEAIIKMAAEWPNQLFWKRLPLLTLFPLKTPLTSNVWSWFKAPGIFFCRYDFFPELVLMAFVKGAVLFSATLKNKSTKGLGAFYNRGLYSLFERIFTASPKDVERFKELGVKGKVSFYDFRQIQILRRLENPSKTLEPLEKLLNSFSSEQRLMLGSCWPYEMAVFSDSTLIKDIQDKSVCMVLAPHKLAQAFVDELIEEARRYFPELDPTIITKEGNIKEGKHSSVIISLLPGVLCEAYSLVSHTFVGGGHGRSVHSLLEPWLSGSEVYCGPRTHRSTEYDLIHSIRPDMIHIVEDPSSLYQTFLECKQKHAVLDTGLMRKDLNEQYLKIMEDFNA